MTVFGNDVGYGDTINFLSIDEFCEGRVWYNGSVFFMNIEVIENENN